MPDPLGLESKVVRLMDYNPVWPLLFEEESTRLAAVIERAGLSPLRLEHVGSTAVPGLAAKPVLDIAAGRLPGSHAAEYVPVIEAAGYIYRGESGVPGRAFFRRGELRSHHIHLVELGSEHWQRYLLFRDALRDDPQLVERYAALKRDLARRYPRDRESYIQGKSTLIDEIVRAASERERDDE